MTGRQRARAPSPEPRVSYNYAMPTVDDLMRRYQDLTRRASVCGLSSCRNGRPQASSTRAPPLTISGRTRPKRRSCGAAGSAGSRPDGVAQEEERRPGYAGQWSSRASRWTRSSRRRSSRSTRRRPASKMLGGEHDRKNAIVTIHPAWRRVAGLGGMPPDVPRWTGGNQPS